MTEADLNWTVVGEAAFSAVDSTTAGTGTEVGTGVGAGVGAGQASTGWS